MMGFHVDVRLEKVKTELYMGKLTGKSGFFSRKKQGFQHLKMVAQR
jgi:hypothetical protein